MDIKYNVVRVASETKVLLWAIIQICRADPLVKLLSFAICLKLTRRSIQTTFITD